MIHWGQDWFQCLNMNLRLTLRAFFSSFLFVWYFDFLSPRDPSFFTLLLDEALQHLLESSHTLHYEVITCQCSCFVEAAHIYFTSKRNSERLCAVHPCRNQLILSVLKSMGIQLKLLKFGVWMLGEYSKYSKKKQQQQQKQQTQPTTTSSYDKESGNQMPVRIARGECSHHYAIPDR